jgi:hypothetical protein
MLGVSYPYLLSVETGQRELSHPLADKIRKVFGVADISQRDADPQILAASGKLVPFTKEEFFRYKTKRPSFWIDVDYTDQETPQKVTPTPAEYGQCAAALLAAAEKLGVIRPLLSDFGNWFVDNISSTQMFETLNQSFDDLFPGERFNNNAYLALTVRWGLKVEDEVYRDQIRKEMAAERAAAKRKKKQKTANESKATPRGALNGKKKRSC